MGISVALSSVSTMMIPITAELHYFIIIALRFLAGAGAVSIYFFPPPSHRRNYVQYYDILNTYQYLNIG